MQIRIAAFALCLLAMAPWAQAANAAPAEAQDIAVNVEIVGDLVRINSSFLVDASPRQAWEVMVDYDHATRFISDLEISRIEKREGNTITVYQKGQTRFGPFSVGVESERRIELTPYEKMESRALRGSMKSQSGTTRLAPEGRGTRITNTTETVPNVWLPPILGPLLVQEEARQKFQQLREEILRRKAAAPTR